MGADRALNKEKPQLFILANILRLLVNHRKQQTQHILLEIRKLIFL